MPAPAPAIHHRLRDRRRAGVSVGPSA
jgi:hypothetical protein